MTLSIEQEMQAVRKGTCSIDPYVLEIAIKVVQASGYEVFKKAAEHQAYATHSVDPFRGPHDERFIEYIKRDMARQLGEHLLKAGIATYEAGLFEPDSGYQRSGRQVHKLGIKCFLSQHKEFARV